MEAHITLSIDIPDEFATEIKKRLSPGQTIEDYIARLVQQETAYISLDDAAKILHMAPSTLYRKASEGVVPFYKPQGTIMFSRSELFAMIEKSRRSTTAETKAKAAAQLSRIA